MNDILSPHPDDLALNRRGKLSGNQKMRLIAAYRQKVMPLALYALLALVAFLLSFITPGEGDNWLVMLGLLLPVWLGILAILSLEMRPFQRDIEAGRCASLRAPLLAQRAEHHPYAPFLKDYQITMGEHTFSVDQRTYEQIKLSADYEGVYAVNSGILVALIADTKDAEHQPDQ